MANRRVHSRVTDELPPEVRRAMDTLLIEGATYDEIKDFLNRKGHDISRSGIGRYGKDFFANCRELKIIEDKSRTLVSDAGGDVMVLEEAAAKIFVKKILEAQLDGKFDVVKLPRLIADFAKLQASTVLRERMKMEFKQKVTKTADEVAKVARSGGLSEEKAAEIRRKILGIV